MEARGGIEPPIKALQAFALPLGDRALIANLCCEIGTRNSYSSDMTLCVGVDLESAKRKKTVKYWLISDIAKYLDRIRCSSRYTTRPIREAAYNSCYFFVKFSQSVGGG